MNLPNSAEFTFGRNLFIVTVFTIGILCVRMKSGRRLFGLFTSLLGLCLLGEGRVGALDSLNWKPNSWAHKLCMWLDHAKAPSS